MPAKILDQCPTLPANGFVQEESAIKVLVEILVHKFRKRNKRDIPSIKMSDLREDVFSMNGTQNSLQKSFDRRRSLSKSPRSEERFRSQTTGGKRESTYDIVSITSEDEPAEIIQNMTYSSVCEIKSLSLDTETEGENHEVAIDSQDLISISSIHEDQYSNESINLAVFEDVDNSIYGHCIGLINVSKEISHAQDTDAGTQNVQGEDNSRENNIDVLTNSSDQTDDRITKIIHELVLQKYEHTLKSFRSRSLKRRKRYSESDLAHYWKKDDEEDSKSDSEDSIDSGLNFSTEDLPRKDCAVTETAKDMNMETKLEYSPRQEVMNVNNNKILLEKSVAPVGSHCSTSVQSLEKHQIPENGSQNELLEEHVAEVQMGIYGNVRQQHVLDQTLIEQQVSPRKNRKNEEVEYDEKKFLTAALGDEFLDTSDASKAVSRTSSTNQILSTPSSYQNTSGGSISSSRISALITSSDKSEGIYSLYSTVEKTAKKKFKTKELNSIARPLFTSVNKDSDLDYESVFEFRNSLLEEELISQNSLQREIIHQASKALQICRSDLAYFGEDVLLEAEKILLVATCKKDVLSKEITKVEYEEIGDSVSVTIALNNIKFRLDYDSYCRSSDNGKWYFICILDAGKTVLSSNLTKHNDNGSIIFGDGFKFEKLSSEIEINLRIYAICVAKHEKKSSLCRTFGRRRRYRLKEAGNVHSSFVLLGNATLRNHSLQSKSFKLSQVPTGAIITDNFSSDLEVFVTINTLKSGFLTVGKTHKGAPIWYRRWCVLEGSRLKYWNYPLETEQEPIGTLDMLNCANQVVFEADKTLCCRPRTIYLEIIVDGKVQQYYLSADNKADMKSWQDNLNTVLRALSKWNYLNCYLVN